MRKQLDWAEEQFALKVPDELDEPRLWVRRFVIWKEPGEVIRDFELQRGLNIIWSPDSHEHDVDLGHGHGAGKSLFCRLIRYCLGESTFADKETRKTIRTQFPNGYVGAEIRIDGATWAVIRPLLGADRRAVAKPGVDLEALFDEAEKQTGPTPLVSALSDTFFVETAVFPDISDDRWRFALAWAARDQECRLRHPLEWRDPRSESGSSLIKGKTSKDDILEGVRCCLGLESETGFKLRTKLSDLSDEQKSTKTRMASSRARAAQLAKRLEIADGEEGEAGVWRLRAGALHREATEELRELATAEESPQASEIVDLDESILELERAKAVQDSEHDRLEALVEAESKALSKLRSESEDLDLEAVREEFGDECDICGVPIEIPVEEGCPYAIDDTQPGTSAAYRQRVVRRKTLKSEEELVRYRSVFDTVAADCQRIGVELVRLRLQKSDLEDEQREWRQQQRENWFNVRQRRDYAKELIECIASYDELSSQVVDLENRAEETKKLIEREDARHAAQRRRLERMYQFVCEEVLGPTAESSISLTNSRLALAVRSGGEAMDSFKIVAFDVAVLLLSAEQRTSLPAFWIHDSPREADLGASIYSRFLRRMASFEQLASRQFQYIVTTTTAPPNDLQSRDYVRLQISAAHPEKRLLKTNLDENI